MGYKFKHIKSLQEHVDSQIAENFTMAVEAGVKDYYKAKNDAKKAKALKKLKDLIPDKDIEEIEGIVTSTDDMVEAGEKLMESVNENETHIEVSVRDARKALSIIRDQFKKNEYDMVGSNYYTFTDDDIAHSVLVTLQDHGIELYSHSVDESKVQEGEIKDAILQNLEDWYNTNAASKKKAALKAVGSLIGQSPAKIEAVVRSNTDAYDAFDSLFEGFSFTSDEIDIRNPFIDHTGRFKVDPKKEYGKNYTKAPISNVVIAMNRLIKAYTEWKEDHPMGDEFYLTFDEYVLPFVDDLNGVIKRSK